MSCVPRFLHSKNNALGKPLDELQIEELSQEVIMIVWRKIATFDGRAQLESWVYRVAALELMNRVRHESIRRPKSMTHEQMVEAAGSTDPPTFEDYTIVHRALGELSPDERDVVHGKYFEHMTFPDMAVRFDISEGTAKSRFYRGLRRLRSLLAQHEEDYA